MAKTAVRPFGTVKKGRADGSARKYSYRDREFCNRKNERRADRTRDSTRNDKYVGI